MAGTQEAHLPPEILRAVGSRLSSSGADLAAARLCSPAWAAALAPLVTQLRCRLDAAPPEQLAAALSRHDNVRSVTLLLEATTPGQRLREALQLVGSKTGVTEVVLCELEGGSCASSSSPPAYYVSADLQLHHLRHVQTLRVVMLRWSLADIWEQVSALSARGCSLHTLVIEHAPGSQVARLTCPLAGLLQPLAAGLRHLTTPLPGQYDSSGAVTCSLDAAQECYVAQLAKGLPGLRSLTVTGLFEGREAVLVGFKQLQELRCSLGGLFRSLNAGDVLHGSHTACRLLATAVGQLHSLHLIPRPPEACGSLTAKLLARGSSGSSTLPAVNCDMFRSHPFHLELLQLNARLQHLSVPLTLSGQDLTAVNGQLRSLVGQCSLPYEELLKQVAAVGSSLTSLALYDQDITPTPRPLQRRPPRVLRSSSCACLAQLTALQSLTLIVGTDTLWTVADPAGLWRQLAAVTSLKLQNIGLGYSRQSVPSADRVVAFKAQHSSSSRGAVRGRLLLWLRDLPCRQLKQLELSRYDIVVEGRHSGAAAAEGRGSGQEQQQHQQQQQQQQQQQAAEHLATLRLQEEEEQLQPIGTCCEEQDLSNLQQLSLVDCSCLLLQPALQQQQQQDVVASSSSSSSSATDGQQHLAVHAAVWCLLQLLLHPASNSSRLRLLELHTVALGLQDMCFIACSPLGQQLHALGVHTRQWLMHEQQQQQERYTVSNLCHMPMPPAAVSTLAGTIAAAAHAGRLQQLRTLWLELSSDASEGKPGVPGLSVLAACASLRSLQQLHLELGASVVDDAGRC